MKKIFLILVLLIIGAGIALGQGGVKKKRALPHEYGNIIINNFSEKAGRAPVEFSHWLHRGMFTCRLCHVDIAFAMKAGATNIRAADNKKGYYCGACHDGKQANNGKRIFESCNLTYTQEEAKKCDRCHSVGRNVRKEHDFDVFAAKLPKERFGNGINWEKAEEDGLIKPVDFLDKASIKRTAMKEQDDFTLASRVQGMPDIIFSHKKHTVWNGCEVCHPEIFVGVKKGATKYSMVEIFDGKYCGVCHIKVAFPLTDCQRCHTKPV